MLNLPVTLTSPELVLSCVADGIIAILSYRPSLRAIAFFVGTAFVVFKSLAILRSIKFFLVFHLEFIFCAILVRLAILAYKLSRSLAVCSLAIYRNPHLKVEKHAERQRDDFHILDVSSSPPAFYHVYEDPLLDAHPLYPVTPETSALFDENATPPCSPSPRPFPQDPAFYDVPLLDAQLAYPVTPELSPLFGNFASPPGSPSDLLSRPFTQDLAFYHVHEVPLLDAHPVYPVTPETSPLLGENATPPCSSSPWFHQKIMSETPDPSWLSSRPLSHRNRFNIDLPDVSTEIPLLPSRLFRFSVDLFEDKPCDAMEVTIAAGDFCDAEYEDEGKMHNLKAYIDEELQDGRGIILEKASLQLDECSHQGCRQLENGHSLIAHALKVLQDAGLLGKLQELHLKFPIHYENNGQRLLRSPSQADIAELKKFYWEGDLRAFPEPWCSLSSMPFHTLSTVSLLQCKISLEDCLAILYEGDHIETLEVNEVEDVSSIMIPVSRSTHITCNQLKSLNVTSAVDLEPLLQRLKLVSLEQLIIDLTSETARRSVVAGLQYLRWDSTQFSSLYIKSPLLPVEREAIVNSGKTSNTSVFFSAQRTQYVSNQR